MGRQLYPYAQVGRPAVRVRAAWTVLKTRQCKLSDVGLVRRIRVGDALTDTSYAVVFSQRAILQNGTLLRSLSAIPYGSGPNCRRVYKLANPKAWHSKLEQAEALFQSLVRRGGRK